MQRRAGAPLRRQQTLNTGSQQRRRAAVNSKIGDPTARGAGKHLRSRRGPGAITRIQRRPALYIVIK